MLGAIPAYGSPDESDDSSSQDERLVARTGRDFRGTQSMIEGGARPVNRKAEQENEPRF
jgi:hypothetical protein